MRKIILVRHGESMANVWKDMYNMHDSFNFLSLKGVKQAELAGLQINENIGTEIDYVISSNAIRAKQTATVIMQSIGEEVWKRNYHETSDLNEWCFGATSEDWRSYESKQTFVNRVEKAYIEHIEDNHNKVTLIASHQYTMRYLLNRFLNNNASDSEKIGWIEERTQITNAKPYFIIGEKLYDDEMYEITKLRNKNDRSN